MYRCSEAQATGGRSPLMHFAVMTSFEPACHRKAMVNPIELVVIPAVETATVQRT
jgi:hypothetical protein